MPVTRWTPQNVTRPIIGAFKPAVFQTANLARATAPGPRTARAVRATPKGLQFATLDALRRGPPIFPIVSGSRAGIRSTSGWFVISADKVVQAIDHPGTPPHPFLNRAQAAFPGLYAANVRRMLH